MSGFTREDYAAADQGNGKEVSELWAWVKVYAPGDEGLVAIGLPGGQPLPPIFARLEVAEQLRPMMEEAQRQQGVPHRLVHFVRDLSTDMS